jgi:hypothetical protein
MACCKAAERMNITGCKPPSSWRSMLFDQKQIDKQVGGMVSNFARRNNQ